MRRAGYNPGFGFTPGDKSVSAACCFFTQGTTGPVFFLFLMRRDLIGLKMSYTGGSRGGKTDASA